MQSEGATTRQEAATIPIGWTDTIRSKTNGGLAVRCPFQGTESELPLWTVCSTPSEAAKQPNSTEASNGKFPFPQNKSNLKKKRK